MSTRLLFIFAVMVTLKAALGSCIAEASLQTFFSPDGRQAFLVLQTVSAGSTTRDEDPELLFQSMNVPEESVNGGVGKTIKTAESDLVIACVTRGTLKVYTCTFRIRASDRAQVNATEQTVQLRARDEEEATYLRSLFIKQETRDDFYLSLASASISLFSTQTEFVFKFKAQ